MIVKALQINIRPLSDQINTLGWQKACEAFPKVKAYLDLSTGGGSEAYTAEMLEHFDLVHVMEAPDLETCFAALNGMPTEGVRFIHRGRGHSLSVGDILVECTPTEQVYHMVDSFGFQEVMREPAE